MALKDIPKNFKPSSEEDLRFAVAAFFVELGLGEDELRFEDYFTIQLGHSLIDVTRQKPSKRRLAGGRSDMLVLWGDKPLAIVETKSPKTPLHDDDAGQAISYARLLRQIAPYAIVTNGHETRVYDTLSAELQPLSSTDESTWVLSGQGVTSITDELRYLAARTLIGINPDTLKAFCRSQVVNGLSNIKGGVFDSRIYVPNIYVSRGRLLGEFNTWLATDAPCFAVVSESGHGKTNFMCAMAEELTESSLVMFYPASSLRQGLAEAIRSDFIWEFHRDRNIAQIIERLDYFAKKLGQPVVIFLDGLDEFPGTNTDLKVELLDFIQHISGRAIRFCLSCKSFDWGDFIIDGGQSYNQLALSIYPFRPSVHSPEQPTRPVPSDIGIELGRFDDSELELAYDLYRDAYSLTGDLSGQMKMECSFPLLLRLVAEAYYGRTTDLPGEITSREVFELYWKRKLSQTTNQRVAENLLVKVAMLCIEFGEKQVAWSRFSETFLQFPECYESLLRNGLLKELRDEHGSKKVAFGYEAMRSYIFAVKAKQWPTADVIQAAQEISATLHNNVGVEAIEFYFRFIERGESSTLCELALLDFQRFLELLEVMNIDSSIEHLEKNDLQASLRMRLEQYADLYSRVSRTHFAEICDRFDPKFPRELGLNQVGVWVHSSTYQFRIRTPAVPQSVIALSDEMCGKLMNGELSANEFLQVLPGGIIYIGGIQDFVEKIPHHVAWSRLSDQLADVIKNRFLLEESTPLLLEERALDILLYSPNIWFEGEPDAGIEFYKLLGFENSADLSKVKIDELIEVVERLHDSYKGSYPLDIPLQRLADIQRGAYFKDRDLIRLLYLLRHVGKGKHYLGLPAIDLEEMSREHKLESVAAIILKLLPEILATYKGLIEANFPTLKNYFALYRNLDRPIYVELSYPHMGNIPQISYAVLSTSDLQPKYLVSTCSRTDSIANIETTYMTMKGSVTRTQGADFGSINLAREINGISINESEVFRYVTLFSFYHPIAEQVYQLIAAEAEFLFGRGSMHWMQANHRGSKADDNLDELIAREQFYTSQ